VKNALLIARALHVGMVACLLFLVFAFNLGAISLLGVGAVITLLAYEHGLVKPNDLSRVNAAFFTVNGYVSLLFFAFWTVDILKHR
jgi:4-hydroxybenzoate polyprenyltransferase